MSLENILEFIAYGIIWNPLLPVLFLLTGLYLTIGVKFFQFRKFNTILANTLGKIAETRRGKDPGVISQFAAWATATGATIGMGNIAGVSSAIALGGPGAVFWMWIAALFGMSTKFAEVILGVKYREVQPDGKAYGGPPYYIERGLGEELKLPSWVWKTLAALFTLTFCSTAVISMSNYTIMEGAMTCFQLSRETSVIVGLIYALLATAICTGFIPRVGKAAELLVPAMLVIYIGGCLGILIKHIHNIPNAFIQIFTYAFTPAAAVGGFAGATVTRAIQIGVARSVYSNEAGWGSAPHIHAAARVDHPVKQGMWGIMEVFLDTIIICSITALTVIVTGVWQTGEGGVGAVLQAFTATYGPLAAVILYISLFLFVLTTSTGWYTYYEVEARYWLKNKPKLMNATIRFFQIGSPFIVWAIGAVALLYGIVPAVFWILGDITAGLPVYINLVVLLILSPIVFKEVRDYESKPITSRRSKH
ncbi:MAG: amino acid carrier protein [Thermofilaceae archaeon]